MMISDYQVNKFLRVYGDQLRQSRVSTNTKNTELGLPDKVGISSMSRRKLIVDEIASKIVDRIMRNGPYDDIEKEVFQKLENEYGGQLTVAQESSAELIFKEIDGNGETIRSLSINDSKFLSNKLTEIAKETIDRNME